MSYFGFNQKCSDDSTYFGHTMSLMTYVIENHEYFSSKLCRFSQWNSECDANDTSKGTNNNPLTFHLCVMVCFIFRVKVIASIYSFCFCHKLSMIFWMKTKQKKEKKSKQKHRIRRLMNRNWYARMLLSFGHRWKSFFLNLIDFYRYYESIPFEIVHTIAAADAIDIVSIASAYAWLSFECRRRLFFWPFDQLKNVNILLKQPLNLTLNRNNWTETPAKKNYSKHATN